MNRFGIHIRLLLTAFLLITATTLTFGYMGENITREFVRSRFDKRLLFLAKYLALNSELGILIDERKMLERLANNLLSEEDVVNVKIYNHSNEILADVSKESIGSISTIETEVYLKNDRDLSPAFQPRGKEQEPTVIGKVSISYTSEGINQLLTAMKSRFIWLSLVLAALCVIIFYFISRSLVAPVTSLVKAAQDVADGNVALRVKPSNLPEARELALAFNAMLDSLGKSQKALEKAHQKMIRQKTLAQMGEFSLMIAHEVKNPLSIIKSSLDILKKEINRSSENTMVLYMEDEIWRLNQLIEDFLIFARPAVPNLRRVDVNGMLRDNLNRYEIQLNEERMDIRFHISETKCFCDVDPDLLMRAIANLIKNAIDANEKKGSIYIKTCIYSDHWESIIEDEGAGIQFEHMDKIFEPFFTTRSKGTGLGLAFAQQVVTAHSGKIFAENRENKGARFIVNIPLNSESTSNS